MKTVKFTFIRFPRQTARFRPGSAPGPELEMSMVMREIEKAIMESIANRVLPFQQGVSFTKSSQTFRNLGILWPLAFGTPGPKKVPPFNVLFFKKKNSHNSLPGARWLQFHKDVYQSTYIYKKGD